MAGKVARDRRIGNLKEIKEDGQEWQQERDQEEPEQHLHPDQHLGCGEPLLLPDLQLRHHHHQRHSSSFHCCRPDCSLRCQHSTSSFCHHPHRCCDHPAVH